MNSKTKDKTAVEYTSLYKISGDPDPVTWRTVTGKYKNAAEARKGIRNIVKHGFAKNGTILNEDEVDNLITELLIFKTRKSHVGRKPKEPKEAK